MAHYYDVTVPLSSAVPVFPGDPRFHMEFTHRDRRRPALQRGPSHDESPLRHPRGRPLPFLADGSTVDQLPLEILIGKCRVIDIGARDKIERTDLESQDLRDDLRVLLKTRMSGQLRLREFQQDFVYLTPDAAQYLVQAGIKLVGIDYLSVEKFGSEDFAAHHALLGAGVVIIEGLDLSEVDAGEYDMTCLPLRVVGADGSPARVYCGRADGARAPRPAGDL